MPVRKSKDDRGPFYQWGSSGTKYYFVQGDERSERIAREKAAAQGAAARASGFKE